MQAGLRNYLIVTGGYWSFTLTDGALRMLVVLYFYTLGYTPLEVALLFVFYELFGVITNLVGGWLGARLGLNATLHLGMALQIVALGMLMVPDDALSVAWVMGAQALSGIAKDLNKMSAKASVRILAEEGAGSRLFRWVSLLTGSKNALKGLGYFLGALLLGGLGFQGAMLVMALWLTVWLLATGWSLPRGLGRVGAKPPFTAVFASLAAVNWLAAARLFLFAARDIWFVVALPTYLYATLGWGFDAVGAFLALWIIAYGGVQAMAPTLLRRGQAPGGRAALLWVALLVVVPAGIALGLQLGVDAQTVLIVGLLVFGVVFALNSAVHSYLILAFSEAGNVSLNVGFYYMANAAGRLLGTVLSGALYQAFGLLACLWGSVGLLLLAALISTRLPDA